MAMSSGIKGQTPILRRSDSTRKADLSAGGRVFWRTIERDAQSTIRSSSKIVRLRLAPHYQVAGVNPLYAVHGLGHLDGALPFLLAVHDAVQAHHPVCGVDVNG
jgi:hypothetical protein